MNSFQTITIVIALTILVAVLGYLGYLMSYGKNKQVIEFPTKNNLCPDKWNIDEDGRCVMPTRYNRSEFLTEELRQPDAGWRVKCGTDSTVVDYVTGVCVDSNGNPTLIHPYSIDPLHNSWTSDMKSSICAKKEWANKHNILWDGVSNYTKC